MSLSAAERTAIRGVVFQADGVTPRAAYAAAFSPFVDDAKLAALLNAPAGTRNAATPAQSLLEWAAGSGRYARIAKAADNAASADDLRTAALVLRNLLESTAGLPAEFNRAAFAPLLNTLVSGAVLTAADRTALIALVSVPSSAAFDAIGRDITAGECGEAR